MKLSRLARPILAEGRPNAARPATTSGKTAAGKSTSAYRGYGVCRTPLFTKTLLKTALKEIYLL